VPPSCLHPHGMYSTTYVLHFARVLCLLSSEGKVRVGEKGVGRQAGVREW